MLLAVSKRRPNLVELGLALLWFHFALTGFRYVSLGPRRRPIAGAF